MVDDHVEVLNREDALKDLITPTGRQYGIVMEAERGLYRVAYMDGKAGSLPAELDGRWTSASLAYSALKAFLVKLWDMSDTRATALERKRYKEAVMEKDANGKSASVSTAA